MLIIKSQSESPIYHFVTQMFELCLSHLLVEYPFPDPDCGSQILFSLLSIMTWRSNAKSKCVCLVVRRSFQQIPFMAAKEAVRGTHGLRVTRFKLLERMDNMKTYARVTYLKPRSCLVNWCAIRSYCKIPRLSRD